MENQPLVTIYTITRNRADLLPRAMKSILGQTYKNIEYLIIDSASTDNTEDVVNSFHDDRIRYIKLEENKTFGACVNMAFDMATGKYVSELDDDDEYRLDKIEKQVELFETLPEDYGMVYCWMTYYDNTTGNQIKIHKGELRGNVIEDVIAKPVVSGTPTLLIRQDVFHIVGGYKESSEIGIESDWELATRICKSYKVDYVAESLVNVFVNHGHLRMSSSSKYYQEVYKKTYVFEKYFLSFFKDEFNRCPKAKIPHLRSLITSLIKQKKWYEAKEYYVELIKISPSVFNILYPIYRLIK